MPRKSRAGADFLCERLEGRQVCRNFEKLLGAYVVTTICGSSLVRALPACLTLNPVWQSFRGSLTWSDFRFIVALDGHDWRRAGSPLP